MLTAMQEKAGEITEVTPVEPVETSAVALPVGNEGGVQRFETVSNEYDDPLVKFEIIERPRPVFFYQRRDADGDVMEDSPIFACYEQEAAMVAKFNKQIGSSDGTTYYNYLKNSGLKKGQLVPRSQAAKILQAAFDAELAVARGKKKRAHYSNVSFDESITRHRNARSIIDGFNPPE